MEDSRGDTYWWSNSLMCWSHFRFDQESNIQSFILSRCIQVGIKSYGPATYGNCDRHKNKIYNLESSRSSCAHATISRSHVSLLCSIAEGIIMIGLLTVDISQGFAMCDCNDLTRDECDSAFQLKSLYMQL